MNNFIYCFTIFFVAIKTLSALYTAAMYVPLVNFSTGKTTWLLPLKNYNFFQKPAFRSWQIKQFLLDGL